MCYYAMVFAQGLERLPEVIVRVDQNMSSKERGYFSFPSHTNCFGVDREAMTKELGFNRLLWNSLGAVSSRDLSYRLCSGHLYS